MRNLLGWLETRLAQTTLNYLEIASVCLCVKVSLAILRRLTNRYPEEMLLFDLASKDVCILCGAQLYCYSQHFGLVRKIIT